MGRLVAGITMIGLGLLMIACDPKPGHPAAKQVSEISGSYPLDSAIRFDDSWNAAYAYISSVPAGSIYVEGGPIDRSVYLSPDSNAGLVFFAENPVEQPQGSFDSVSNRHLHNYYRDIETGKHREVKGCRPVQTQFRYADDSLAGEFTILGEVGQEEFIWKSILSEWPVTGELIFKTMLFRYPKVMQEKYQPIGIELAKRFGDFY